MLKTAALTLVGLFVDDGNLALTVALILVATAFAASTPWIDGLWLGAVFVAAIALALLVNVRHAAIGAGGSG